MQVAKVLAAAAIAALFGVVEARAVAFTEIDGPAEYPPAGFAGNQYVDSKGCVFMRAGYAGQVNWVPRITRDKQVICGQRPSLARGPAADPGPPMDTIATTTTPPRVRAVPPGPAPRMAPERYAGAPVAAQAVSCPAQARLQRVTAADGRETLRCMATVAGRAPEFTIPEGYKLAWQDDRLNPLRAVGTPQGEAAMDSVWTRQVPARLVRGGPVTGRQVTGRQVTGGAMTVTVSSKAAPAVVVAPVAVGRGARSLAARSEQAPVSQPLPGTAAPAATLPAATLPAAGRPASTGGRYVQVGTFGVPANAEGAAARLRAAGLPVVMDSLRRNGKPLQVVMAGPFGPDQIGGAVSLLRGAGFADAYVR